MADPLSRAAGDEEAFRAIVGRLEEWSGCPFSHYRAGTLRRRMERRMAITGQPDLAHYLCYITENPQELERLLDSVTLKVSEFFRDHGLFQWLATHWLPPLVEARSHLRGGPEIRVWSAACAHGEEPYSLAILVVDYLDRKGLGTENCTILGTDIDPSAVERAREGIYPKEQLAKVMERYGAYFLSHPRLGPDRLQVVPRVRNLVDFACFDLSSPRYTAPPAAVFAEYDLVFVRNVMIYYDDQIKGEMMAKLHRALRRGGLLVLGRSERLPGSWEPFFQEVERRFKVYRRVG